LLAKSLTDWSHDKKNVVHTISKNFRSRPAILEFSNAKTHVKNLQTGRAWKEGDQGEVTEGVIKYDDAFNQLRDEKEEGKAKQTAFIARTNEPLVHSALRLLSQSVPFLILGKDIVGDLVKHIRKITNRFGLTDDHNCDELADRMHNFLNQETDTHGTRATKRAYLHDLNEATEAIMSCMGQFNKENNAGGTIKQFKGWLSERLGSRALEVQDNEADFKEYRKKMEEENPIVLTTAHKSKGLEFLRVYILRHDLFPHKKAKRPKDLAQEANAKYVSYTRAKDELHILALDGQPGYQPPK
jgi:hypothetical protein